jgi:hypothetical protein
MAKMADTCGDENRSAVICGCVCVCVCVAVNHVMKIRKIFITFPMSILLCMHLWSSNRQY